MQELNNAINRGKVADKRGVKAVIPSTPPEKFKTLTTIVELLGVSQLASKISLIRPEMAVFLTKCSKKREGAFHN